MTTKKATIIAVLILAIGAAAPAGADIQNSAQRACIIGVNKAAIKLVKAVRRTIGTCTSAVDAAGGTAQDIIDCVIADERGKIQTAQGKVLAAEQKHCTATPDFGYTSGATVNTNTLLQERALAGDVYGDVSELDADATGCRRAVTADYAKIGSALLTAYQACVSDGLKTAAIESATTMQECYDAVSRDERGKISKATIKLMLDFLSRCSIDELGQLLPGFCGAAAGVLDFGLCMDGIVRCRTCLLVNSINDLDEDCDRFDNGSVDGTCPPGSVVATTTTSSTTTTTVPVCGDGHLQVGEMCDDHNPNNQDMCTNQCHVAVCGDHIRCSNAACTTGPNGGVEECDGLASAACPGACLDNCACAGATMPPTTTTTTTTTTSTTTTTTLADVIETFDQACVHAVLNVPFLGGDQLIAAFGSVSLRYEWSGLGDHDNDGKEDIEVEVTNLLFTAQSDQGQLTVRLADPLRHPTQNQITRGLVEENVDTTSDLDWTPHNGGGSATVRFDRAFIEAQIVGQINNTIHHDVPISLLGTLDADPPTANHPLNMQNTPPQTSGPCSGQTKCVPALTPSDAVFLNSSIRDLTLDLTATTCE